jgi:cystathionine beta-lyase
LSGPRRTAITYDFDELIDRRDTPRTKRANYQGLEVIPLRLPDMDFRSPPAVIEALTRRCEHGVSGYVHPPIGVVDTVLV